MRHSLGQYIQQSHVNRHIQIAWGGGVLVALFHVVPGVLGIATGEAYAWASLLGGIVYSGLSFGIYRRKLAAAAAMLALFFLEYIGPDVLQYFTHSGVRTTIPEVILVYVFGRAVKELWDLRTASRAVSGEAAGTPVAAGPR